MIQALSASGSIDNARHRMLVIRTIGVLFAIALVGITGIASALIPTVAIALISAISVALVMFWIRFDLQSSVMLLCGTADILIHFRVGAVSLMGVATILLASGAWLLWWISPVRAPFAMPTTWPLLIYGGWSLFSTSALSQPSVASVQNLFITLGFIGLILLSTSTAVRHPYLFERVGHFLILSAWITSVLFLLRPVLGAIDPRLTIGARQFALVALFGLAWCLVQSRYGKANAHVLAAILMLLIIVSLSRMATATAMILFVISRFSPGKVRGWLRFLTAIAVAGMTAYLAVTQIQAIRDRFTQGYAPMTVGSVTFNASGRTNMWDLTVESFLQSPWIGHGVGSATRLIVTEYPNLGHPHNEYLRILHDLGIVGMSLWLAGIVLLLWVSGREWLRLDRLGDPRARIHLTALLSLVTILLTMMTDNVVVYAFVMFPAAVIIGTSIGTLEQTSTDSPTSQALASSHRCNQRRFCKEAL